jgi:predicted O-methyltransferase YrrM
MARQDRYKGEPPELRKVPVFRSGWQIRAFAAVLAPNNLWAEFGVGDGTSARFFLDALPSDGRLHLFDSWKGLPDHWYANKGAGYFGDLEPPVFADKRVRMHKGFFEETLPLKSKSPFGLVHVDCDIYSSTKTVLERVRVTKGTIMLFDELFGYGSGPNEGVWREHEYKALMEWNRDFRFLARDISMRAAIEVL